MPPALLRSVQLLITVLRLQLLIAVLRLQLLESMMMSERLHVVAHGKGNKLCTSGGGEVEFWREQIRCDVLANYNKMPLSQVQQFVPEGTNCCAAGLIDATHALSVAVLHAPYSVTTLDPTVYL